MAREEQVQLLAWFRVHIDPLGKKERKRREIEKKHASKAKPTGSSAAQNLMKHRAAMRAAKGR